MKKIVLSLLLLGLGSVAWADNTNPQAIKFDNEVARPMADQLAKAYYQCKVVEGQWSSQNLGNVIPNDSALIDDGSTVASGQADGRNPVTDAYIEGIDIQCLNFTNMLEANNNSDLIAIMLVSVNP